MNRLHNKYKYKNTNKKRTCKSNKEIRKTLKSCGCRRGRSNKKGGSKGCLSCLSCFRGNGVHSRSKTERINNEIKLLYIYTIYNGILYYYTREHQYLTTFDEYRSKLTSHIAYLTDGQPAPSRMEKESLKVSLLQSRVNDLDSNLMTARGHGHNAPISGVNDTNRQLIKSEFKLVMATANQDQPPFYGLNELLNKCVNLTP